MTLSLRCAALLLPLALAACHRGKVADVTLDADAAAENVTAEKTLADIAAAEAASRRPLPRAVEDPAPDRQAAPAAERDDREVGAEADTNEGGE